MECLQNAELSLHRLLHKSFEFQLRSWFWLKFLPQPEYKRNFRIQVSYYSRSSLYFLATVHSFTVHFSAFCCLLTVVSRLFWVHLTTYKSIILQDKVYHSASKSNVGCYWTGKGQILVACSGQGIALHWWSHEVIKWWGAVGEPDVEIEKDSFVEEPTLRWMNPEWIDYDIKMLTLLLNSTQLNSQVNSLECIY